MKSKITKIQLLKKGIAMIMATMFLTTPIVSATTSLDDSYLESSFWEQILYGEIGSTAKEIEEWFNSGKTTLYIKDDTQLRALAEYVNNGNSCLDKEIILLNNVEVDSNKEWIPIGNKDNHFKGTFNGKGYSISGINFNRKDKLYSEISNVGLFGVIIEGKIKNLNIENSKYDISYNLSDDILEINKDLTSGNITKYDCLGAIAGYSKYSTIENCTVDSTVTVNGLNYVGGLIGYSWGCDIINCTNESLVYGFTNVGGISGGIVSDVENITANNVNYIKSNDSKFSRAISCINKGDIHGVAGNVGGIFGSMLGDVIAQRCENTGKITTPSENFTIAIEGEDTTICTPGNVGGIVGVATGLYDNGKIGSATIDACINKGMVSGYREVGGIAGSLGSSNGGHTIFTNNINYNTSVYSEIEVGYLAGRVGTYGAYPSIEANAYVYMANNFYFMGGSNYDYDYVENNESTMSRSLGFGELNTFSVINIDDETPVKSYNYYYETNNIEPIVEDMPNLTEEEKSNIYINNATIFYYDGVNEEFKIRLHPDAEREIKMNDKSALDSFNLKLVATENSNGPTIQLGEEIAERRREEDPLRTYSTVKTIQFSDEDAFVVDEKTGLWTIKQENKLWENDKKYIINNETGATVEYVIEKESYLGEMAYGQAVKVYGTTYYKEKDRITIKAIFEGVNSLNDVSKKLSLKTATGEIVELGEGTVIGSQINYTYEVKPGDEFEIVELIQDTTITVPVDGIFVDSVSPVVKSKVYVENELETERYTAGKDVFIELTTSERIDDIYTEVPVVQVEFSKSGIGKYNYLRKEGKAGFAKCEEGIINLDGTTTWIYKYQIQEGDEGALNLKYTTGEIRDLAGNTYDLKEQDIVISNWEAEDLNVTYKLYKNSISPENEIKGKAKLTKDDDLLVVIEYDKVLYTMIGNVNIEEANEKFEDRYKEFAPSIYLNGNSKLKGSIESINVSENKTSTVYKYDFNSYELNKTLNLEKIVLKNENNERFQALGSFREGAIVYSAEYYDTYLSDANADASGLPHQEYGFIDKDKTKELMIEDISVIINSENGGYIYADTTLPTVKITPTITVEEKLYTIPFDTTNANEIIYVFEFSEYVTGFALEDITVNGGIKGDFKVVEEGLKYMLTVKPTIAVQKEGALQVIVEKGACIDQVAKENVRQEKNIIIDKIKPTLQSYEIYQEEDKIIADFIFSESISNGNVIVTLSNINKEFPDEHLDGYIDEEEPNKIRCIYTKNAEFGGKVKASYDIEVEDLAGNESGLITVESEEEFVLEQTIIKPSTDEDTFYTFGKNSADINNFAHPTYFKAGDIITVKKHTTSSDVKTYKYKVEEVVNLTQMKYMTLIEPEGEATEGTVSFSNTSGDVEITDANIYFDTVAPTVTLSARVEERNEVGVYTKGKTIIITATTNEKIQEAEEAAPEIKVSFTNSGLGKFNYQTVAGKGNAIHFDTIINENGTTTWEYYYIVENGDDGTAIIEYAKPGKVSDLAGNETSFKLYPDVNRGNTNLKDNVISGTDTKVSFEIYKNTEKITDFTKNTYFTAGDKIKVVAMFNKLLYSKYEQLQQVPVDSSTAPNLTIDGKEFKAENVNNDITNLLTTITYSYDITAEDSEEALESLNITNNTLVALYKEVQNKETAEGIVEEEIIKTETISNSIVNNKDIKNCNLHIYNNSTLVAGEEINVDTIEPKVAIKFEREITVEGVTTKEEIRSATNANKIFYTIEFSEQITNFDENAITINGGIKDSLREVEEGRKYSLEVIPSVADGNVGNVQIIIEKDACLDKVGQGNVRLEKIITVDKKAPILLGIEAYAQSNSDIKLNEEIDIVKEYYRSGDVVTIVAMFDENVNTTAKLLLQFSKSGNAKGTVSQAVREGNRITYTYTITDGDKGSLGVKTFTGEATDAAGNKIIVTKRALDGDTIIADTIKPILKEIKVVTPDANGSYKAGTQIKIEAIYDEEIYVLENNEIKLVKTDIEVINEDGTKTYTNNAPTLKIKFGSGEVKEAIISGYGKKEDGSEDRTKLIYSYEIIEEHEKVELVDGKEEKTIIPGDNGILTVVSYRNKDNVQVCDIAGNTAELDADRTGSVITADTEGPEVVDVTAQIKKPTVLDTEIYHKAGNEIEIAVTYNEKINEKLTDTIKVAFSEEDEKVFRNAEFVEWNKDTDTIKYKYTIETGDNGHLLVKVPYGVCKDIAGNENIESDIFTVENVYADTTNPYLATNINGTSKLEINWIKNDEGIVTGVELVALFSEVVYSKEEDYIMELVEIPSAGIFADGELRCIIPPMQPTIENGKTKLVYRKDDITSIDTTGTVSANFIDGIVYDRAGNEMTIESIDGDMTSPKFKDIKILTPIGFYKAGDKIEILARFNEQTNLTSTLPKLTIKVGEKIVELVGEYNPEDSANIDSIKVAKYTYEIVDGDNGALSIISLIGSVSDGYRTNDKISQIYIDLTDDGKDDINGEADEILDSEWAIYTNSGSEYSSVMADTTEPYITNVSVKVNEEVVASYIKEEGKDSVTSTTKTNVNELEYVIRFSENVKIADLSGIKVYNGEIIKITNSGETEEDYYREITLKVAATTEGVQSLVILDNAIKDKAGNGIILERFNMVTTDFTKPTVRFISEYNGGVYVLPTSIGKVEIRTNVEINEDISKIEYKWDNNENEDYARIEQYASTSDIIVPTKEFTTDGEHTLYIRVTDIAGNVTEASKEYTVSASIIDITAENEGLVEGSEEKLAQTNGNVIVTVEFGIGLTDNRRVVFKAEGSNEYKEIVPNENGTYTITENGFVYAEATDKVGNKVVEEEKIDNIDKEAPTVEIALPRAALLIGTKADRATIKTDVKLSDNKWVEDAKFAYLQEDIDIYNMSDEDKVKITSELDDEARIDNAESTKDEVPYYLYVIAKDEAGNERIEKAGPFIVLDTKEKELITITPPKTEDTETEDTETEGEDAETVQKIPADIEISKLIAFKQEGKFISIMYNNFTEGEEYLDIIKDADISLTEERDGNIDYENKSYVEVNGATTITVIGTDACGNQVTATYEVTKESLEGPEFEVIGNAENWTNQDVKLEVVCYEELSALTANGTNILSQDVKVRSHIIVTENGDYEFIATDTYGNVSKKTITVSKIDKVIPEITEIVAEKDSITITATDTVNEVVGSGIAEYAITDTTETPLEWSESNVINTTKDGTFYVWAKDNAGNIIRAEKAIIVDTTAPTISFSYLSQTVTVGMPIEANVTTDENAIISYSWDKENWIDSEELILSLTVSEKSTTLGKATLYVKAKDEFENESKVASLEFNIVNIEEIKQPEIIFEDMPTIQVNGAKYIRVPSNMTTEMLTDSMNKEALCGKTPEYTKLTEENSLKTGTEITLNGEVKYIVVVNGDVNCDGEVTFLADIVMANNYRMGQIELKVMQKLAADINNSGIIEFIPDIVAMNNYRLGIIKTL